MLDLTVSLVLYKTDEHELKYVLDSLLNCNDVSMKIYLVDNSPTNKLSNLKLKNNVTYIFNNANVGYGAGHNVAIKAAKDLSKYHLIINSDVDFDPAVLKEAFDYMQANEDVGMVSPQICFPDGKLQRSFRKLPTPFDLIARRFIPSFITGFFKNTMDDYLLIDKDPSKSMNIPNLAGCFMFARTALLNKVGGFDEGFFMYVEDVDLTRRLFKEAKTMYYPNIVIKHALAQGSRKVSKLLLYHIKSAIYYFNKWGWFNDAERSKINSGL